MSRVVGSGGRRFEDEVAPLSTRSVLLSLLLGTEPPVLPVRTLVHAGALFGASEPAVRTALSRMTAAGDLTTDGEGRYELTPRLAERQRRQAISRHPTIRKAWRGEWRAMVIRPRARAAGERAELRRAMERAHFAEWREGLWVRPENLTIDLPAAVLDVCDGARLRPDGDGAEFAAELWDLDGWAQRGEALATRLDALIPRLGGGATAALSRGFVTSAAVLRHLLTDPLLPVQLLPAGWPGEALRSTYDRFDNAFRASLGAWFRAQRSTT